MKSSDYLLGIIKTCISDSQLQLIRINQNTFKITQSLQAFQIGPSNLVVVSSLSVPIGNKKYIVTSSCSDLIGFFNSIILPSSSIPISSFIWSLNSKTSQKFEKLFWMWNQSKFQETSPISENISEPYWTQLKWTNLNLHWYLVSILSRCWLLAIFMSYSGHNIQQIVILSYFAETDLYILVRLAFGWYSKTAYIVSYLSELDSPFHSNGYLISIFIQNLLLDLYFGAIGERVSSLPSSLWW